MDNNTTYLMTKELDLHTVQIASLNDRVKNQQKTIAVLGISTLIGFIGIAAGFIEMMLFEEKVDERLKQAESDSVEF